MFLIFPLLLVSAIGPQIDVRMLDGQTHRGTIATLGKGLLVLSTADKPLWLSLADVELVRSATALPASAAKPGAWIELVDGSQLLAEQYTVEHGTARFTILGGGDARISTRRIRAVRFHEQSPDQAADWRKILARDRKGEFTGDLVVLRKDHRLDFVSGVLDDVGPDAASFRLDRQPIRVPRAKIEGLVYFQAPAAEPRESRPLDPNAATVADRFGSRFASARIMTINGSLRIATPSGLEVDRPLGDVAQIDFSAGKIVYLSDLEPESVQWTPYFSAGRLRESLGRLFAPRKDHALLSSESAGDDGALQLRFVEENGATVVRSFAKGLAVHSRTSMVFALPDNFRRFKATVGIDARVGNEGHVRLILRGDDRELYAGDVIGGDPPLRLDLDIAGVRKLKLLADYGQQLDVADHLDLCDAKLVK